MNKMIILGFSSNISESTTSLGSCGTDSGTTFSKGEWNSQMTLV